MGKSAKQVIDEKGGPAAVAKAVGKEPGAVRQWKMRNQIPRTVWPEVTTAYPELTQDVLLALEKAR